MARKAAKARRGTIQRTGGTRGALIKGMSRRLPADLLEEPAFKIGLKSIMRGYAGVYALYRKDRLYYVGLATNLYWRLWGHTRNRHRGKWDSFSIYRVDRVRYLKDIETLLLRVAVPPGNAVSGNVHRDRDLTRVLLKIHREQTSRLKRIRKALRAQTAPGRLRGALKQRRRRTLPTARVVKRSRASGSAKRRSRKVSV